MASPSPKNARLRLTEFFLLLALTFGALFVHGYHLAAEDAEVYLTPAKQMLNPALYPGNSAFIQPFAKLSIVARAVAWTVRITHLPFDWAVFAWYVVTLFVFLWGCYRLASLCFAEVRARWFAVAVVAALLTIPISGTAIYLLDPYVTSRSLGSPALVWLIVEAVRRRYVRAALWLVIGAAVHPLMVVFAASYAVVFWWMDRRKAATLATGSGAALVMMFPFTSPSPEYHQSVLTRPYFFLQNWTWYEWLGAIAPLLILWWFGSLARKHGTPMMEKVARSAAVYGAIYLLGSIIFTMPPRFEMLARLQPMRSLYIVYLLMLLVGAGLLATTLKRRVRIVALLLVPTCAGMFLAQRALYPASAHVEWPWAAPRNPWVQAFVWVRHNTPADALFALDANHMQLPGEDFNGFRLQAERSRLADGTKDMAIAAILPDVAATVQEQAHAQTNSTLR